MRNQIKDEDENFENGILKDGRSFRVDVRMADSLGKKVAEHFAKPAHITDQFGSDGLALNRPGYRHIASGPVGDAMGRLKAQRDAADAYALDEHWKANAYKKRDWAPEENGDDDDLLEARKQGIRSELSRAGGDDDDIEEYLNNCDDDEILHSNSDEHRAAFVAKQSGRDSSTQAVDKAYSDYSREIENAWRRG